MNETNNTIRTLVILEVVHEDVEWWKAIGVPDPARWNQELEDQDKNSYVTIIAERRES